MKITLTEASRLLGQSPRQVRYRIKFDEWIATKEGGRWVVAGRGGADAFRDARERRAWCGTR